MIEESNTVQLSENATEEVDYFIELFDRPSLLNSTINTFLNEKDNFADYEHTEYDEIGDDATPSFDSCRCLPACSSIQYDVEISQTKSNTEKHLKDTGDFETGDDEYDSVD
jgi:hypothetical protein